MSARVDPSGGFATLPATPASGGGRFADTLRRAIAAVDALPAAPTPNDAPDARAMLELQTAVYRQAERVELGSRLLDHAVGAVKTILQTRV